MLAAVFKDIDRVTLDNRDLPEPGPDEVLLQIKSVAICGTDLKIIRGEHFRTRPGTDRVLGHELAGTIADVGKSVTRWKVGQRVSVVPNIGCGCCECCYQGFNHMCPDYDAVGINIDGGFQQFMLVSSAAVFSGNLIAIPDQMSFEEASIIEPLSCCFNAWKQLQVTAEDRVLILGSGAIAALFLQLAKAFGVRQAIVVGRRPDRIAEVAKLGATDTVDSSVVDVVDDVMRLTQGKGVDAAVICAPSVQLQQQAIGCMARFGRLNFFSGLAAGIQPEIDTNKIHYWGLRLMGSTGSGVGDFARVMQLMVTGQVDVNRVITHKFAMEDAVSAFDHALAGNGLKTLILPQESAVSR